MQSIDFSQLNRLDEDFKSILDEVPEKRRDMHVRIAEIIKDEVDSQIAKSGLNDSSGRVKQWQESHVGSGGGYAAVRATDSSTGDNSPGAITNYLENGHKIRRPSGNNSHYRPRIKKPYVDGFHFYSSASNTIESKAIEAAENYVKEITQRLEG